MVEMTTDLEVPRSRGVDSRALLTGEGLPECDQQVISQCRNNALGRFVVGGAMGGALMHFLLTRRKLMPTNRRFLVTTAFTIWSAVAAALSSSSQCIRSIQKIQDPNSLLKKELTRVVVMHNPSIVQKHIEQKSTQS